MQCARQTRFDGEEASLRYGRSTASRANELWWGRRMPRGALQAVNLGLPRPPNLIRGVVTRSCAVADEATVDGQLRVLGRRWNYYAIY